MSNPRFADFSGDLYFLSNFYPCEILIKGILFANVEQYFQWSKCITKQDKDNILSTDNPGEAKCIGRKVKINPNWDNIREYVMYEGLIAKFTQNEDLKSKLLSTDDSLLVEGNNWGDKFWGVDYYTRIGENKLGKLLCKVKINIKKEG